VRLRFLLGLLGCALGACGGQTFTVSAADGGGTTPGGDAGSGEQDAGGGDAAPPCVTEPSNTGGEQQFCDDEQHIFSKCGNCESCRQQDLNDCRTLGDVLSDGFKKALHDCRDSNICGDYTSYAGSPCVRQEFAASQPTSAQKAARDQYCKLCQLTNPNECAHFFDLGVDAGAGATSGVGVYVLVASDPIANTMTSGCSAATPTPSPCGALAYLACTGAKLCAAAPAENCKTGICAKP
jgi:hypothetical protein